MGRGVVGHPIEAALTRAAPHQHQVPAQPRIVQPTEVLRLDDVTIAYDRHPVVHHISGTFEQGSLTALVGLAGLEHQPIGKLSVGQFQRVLFARLMVQDAALILVDEPFNAIDQKTTADLMQVVRTWQAEGRTVIAALHDLEQVREHFEQVLLLARERVAWGPTAEVLKAEHLFKARQMAEAWDEAAPRCEVAG